MNFSTFSALVLATTVGLTTGESCAAFPLQAESINGEAAEGEVDLPAVPKAVNVQPYASDEEIQIRLERILTATGWFQNPQVDVDQGVVFLRGFVDTADHRQWATRLAENTEDVVAVVNQLQEIEPPLWNFAPATRVIRDVVRDAVQAIPLIAVAFLILLLTWLASKIAVMVGDATILRRIDNNLLREVARKSLAVPVILAGVYLIFMTSGLSRLAVTVLGGTGIFGLVLGIAFRDIVENFLSSILISIQNPFRYGDLIKVNEFQGFVQRVNTRGTLLMTLEGNHIQIPNSTIYKNVIVNYTSNPNVRLDFVVGVGYDASLTHAQDVAMQVLRAHPHVLDDPEPMVLVEQLGSATVKLRVYFWMNSEAYSVLKVNSSVMRQVVRKLESAGISMPDDAREVIFPEGIPLQMLPEKSLRDVERQTIPPHHEKPPTIVEDEQVSTSAEGNFISEAEEIRAQARVARDPEGETTDLLSNSPDSSDSDSSRE